MGVVETALLRAAGSAVSSAVKRWLGRRSDQRERETPLVELIGAGIADDVGLRRASRRLDDIKDTVYERLRPLVRRRDDELPENEIAAALDAVTATLDAADLSDAALFADDLDPVLMAARLRRQLPNIPERAVLNDAAAHLYGRVLDECCVCLTQLVIQLGPFQARAAVQMLERLTTVADSLDQVLARLPVTSLDAPAGTNHDTEFRSRYLSHLLTTLDHLELFGVDLHRYRLRTPLSIAYISLAVSGATIRNQRGTARWDPGLLRRDIAESASVRAEQALGNAERVLLRGDAGSGKTTLLRWIAVTAARHGFTGDLDAWNGRTPFLIRLRDHVKQPLPPPEQFLDVIAGPIAGLMPPGWAHRHLGRKAILLVDGVDEVPKGQRREVRDWVGGLLSAYPDLRVVVTSRPAAASARWLNAEGFAPVFLERMGPADVRSLIRHWHDAVRHAGDLPCEPHRLPGYEQRLLAQLDGNAHLQNLAASPLLCAMLCALNLDRDSNLPRNRMDIYQAAVDMLLKRRDEKRGVQTTMPVLTSRDQLQLLQQVAWWLTLNNRTELSREEAENQISQRLAGIRHITAASAAVLEHMIERSGILREPVPDRIDFVHRTFQEYLAAREAADQGHAGVLCEHAHLDTWRETIILAVGHANVPIRNEILAGLLDRADRKPKHARRLRLLGAACLETAPAVEPQLLDAVRSHLRELVPRSIAEARSLAAVGEPLLAELPDDITILTEAQAAATVRTAALVNGPAALTTLANYASDPRPRVQRQLIKDWEYFDPSEYANKVLADAPLLSGHVEIRNTVLLPALSRLRRLTHTSVTISHKLDLDRL
ncbi:MAG TPA: NACHT domain-containing protein, partial [Micromonosporaceae bacterium]|nr:NACHT domain-containing protein [Micromonosporaceae bacterium]